MVGVFMALLSFRGFDTPSLPAQGEQRRSTYFNIGRDNSETNFLDGKIFAGRRVLYVISRGGTVPVPSLSSLIRQPARCV
jgi:hypothetical protein